MEITNSKINNFITGVIVAAAAYMIAFFILNDNYYAFIASLITVIAVGFMIQIYKYNKKGGEFFEYAVSVVATYIGGLITAALINTFI